MHNSAQPVVFDVAQGEICLMVGVGVAVSEVLLVGDVPIHDAGLPEHLRRRRGVGIGLNDKPKQRRRH